MKPSRAIPFYILYVIMLSGCDLKKDAASPRLTKSNRTQSLNHKDRKNNQPPKYIKRSKLHQQVEREQVMQYIRGKWDKRINGYFEKAGKTYLDKYKAVKKQNMIDSFKKLKEHKMSRRAAFNINLQSQMKLKKELGPEVYKGYLKELKDENELNEKSGIAIKIQI